MALRLLPDVEALALAYLKADASMTTLVAGRIATRLPPSPTFPCLTVSLVTGTEVVAEHLDESVLSLAAWADSSVAANLVIRTARAVLLAAPDATHSRGVVTRVRTLSPPRWLPDPVSDRPRYICDLGLTAHPHPL